MANRAPRQHTGRAWLNYASALGQQRCRTIINESAEMPKKMGILGAGSSRDGPMTTVMDSLEDIIRPDDVNSPENAMTMFSPLHIEFGSLDFALQPTDQDIPRVREFLIRLPAFPNEDDIGLGPNLPPYFSNQVHLSWGSVSLPPIARIDETARSYFGNAITKVDKMIAEFEKP
ncbi:uncharacterized protein CDV56_105294 [Aspergillus thermomutatus]|uniref:HNH nuclease domain-containing protein n=1 Tax=Aspergillus thermomutatus TaxID=41047 RepID=A0A397GUC0_ASPTH|nr:uncharacterized protein CDV56_105294 [Aspergillus thermomutatus]RHZ54405.1 hypothetical protein CDV56_105294 [Aspergillus thermomutatus]